MSETKTIASFFGGSLYLPTDTLSQDMVNLKVLTMEIDAARDLTMRRAKLLIERARAVADRARREKPAALNETLALLSELLVNMERLRDALT